MIYLSLYKRGQAYIYKQNQYLTSCLSPCYLHDLHWHSCAGLNDQNHYLGGAELRIFLQEVSVAEQTQWRGGASAGVHTEERAEVGQPLTQIGGEARVERTTDQALLTKHYCPITTDQALLTKHYCAITTDQELRTKHYSPSTMVQSLLTKHY